MALANPQTKSDWLVTIEGLSLFALTFSGINDTAPTSEYSDGFNKLVYTRIGAPKLAPLTFTFGDDPLLNAELYEFWQRYKGSSAAADGKTVVCQAVRYEPEPVNVGSPITLYDFRPSAFQGAEADKASADTAVITLTGVCTRWKKR